MWQWQILTTIGAIPAIKVAVSVAVTALITLTLVTALDVGL